MLTSRVSVVSGLLLSLVAFGAGCGSKSGESTGDTAETMTVAKACLASFCDQKNTTCAQCSQLCDEADYDCDPTTACSDSCSACTDDQVNQCADEGFKATLPKTPDANLEASCNGYLASVTACGGQTIDPSVCTLFAKTEKPAMAATYDCYANLPCTTTDTSSCDPTVTTFGDDLADATKVKCPLSLDDKGKTQLDMEGAWLRDDVMQAVRDCANLDDCSEADECYETWYSAVLED